MIRKILRWIGIVFSSLVGLLVLAFGILYFIGRAQWKEIRRNYDVPVETISIPAGPEAIARGEHVVTIHMCRVCHTETLSGQAESLPGLITLAFPNLTGGPGGVGATNTDEDWVRAIRHGVGHDGRGLILMPAQAFYYISDEDLGAAIAYLKSLPPVDNRLPQTELYPLGYVMLALGKLPPEASHPDVLVIDHTGPRPVAPPAGPTAAYGQYLTQICTICHGEQLNGRTIREGGNEYVALNLTPGGEVGFWSEEQFIATMRTGVTPSGRQLKDFMPWKYFGQMTDEELHAVWLYLQSLPALEQGK